MKRITTSILTAGLALGLGTAAFAKGGHGKGKWQQKRVAKLMKYDADGSGDLNQLELLTALKAGAEKRHTKVDLNHDGFVTKAERQEFRTLRLEKMKAKNPKRAAKMEKRMERRLAKKQARLQKRMLKLDGDGDGKISLFEAQARAEKKAVRMMEKRDLNKDGVLSESELKARMGKRARKKMAQ